MPSRLEYALRQLFWLSNRPFVKGFMIRPLNVTVDPDSDPMPRRPFVLVSNHANFLDPWMVGFQSRDALFIMMNDDGFRGSRMRRLYLHAVGAFGKKKGAHDYKAMKRTLNLLKGGFPVLIFPEGQTSWDGETQPIYSGVEKIIKRGRCPLVMMHLRGNFLTRPWWAEHSRKGKIVVKIKVLDAGILGSIPDPDLLETIKTYIYNNDIKNPENRAVPFTGSGMAVGLERFVWICKQCGAEDALVTGGNTITCTACSASWEMDARCVLTPRMPTIGPIGDLHDWTAWHKQEVKARVARARRGALLTESKDVLMQTEGPGGEFVDRITGTLSLYPEKIVFAPSDSGGAIVEWPLDTIEDYVIQLKDLFEFRNGKEYLRFLFRGHSPMKWIFYVRYMKGYDEIEERGYY
ncbi:MAG: hypothetical protein GF418_08310 [Chitinivibrionales bacterium]|nr:hypothetical protein [Chitinivibrionales bacterium]MBD3395616.1 hypothetical protein [Chitinivibrionales bacterium]